MIAQHRADAEHEATEEAQRQEAQRLHDLEVEQENTRMATGDKPTVD
jgi:hypothetical protein